MQFEMFEWKNVVYVVKMQAIYTELYLIKKTSSCHAIKLY